MEGKCVGEPGTSGGKSLKKRRGYKAEMGRSGNKFVETRNEAYVV